MTKSEIYEAFDQKISKVAIVERDGNYVIQVKWSIIERVDDLLDVFICNPNDMTKGLSQRKVNSMISHLKTPPPAPFKVLTGEAWTQVASKDFILQNLDLLGIRKKRQYSDEHIKKSVETLRRARNAKE